MEDETPIPTVHPPVLSECGAALNSMEIIWQGICQKEGWPQTDFLETYALSLWRAEITGDYWLQEIGPHSTPSTALIDGMMVCAAYAVEAIRSHFGADIHTALLPAIRCAYWRARVESAYKECPPQTLSLSDFARAGAFARHVENRQMKLEAIEWFKANRAEFDNNKTKAAMAIAGKVVPAEFDTVRAWLKRI